PGQPAGRTGVQPGGLGRCPGAQRGAAVRCEDTILAEGLCRERREPCDDRGNLSPARRHAARHRVCRRSRRHPSRPAGRATSRRSFCLLTAGRRTALPRHQTLRATLDWSYELLPEAERCLLRRLALFPAGFTLDAATAVMSDTGSAAPAVLD